MNRKSAVKFMQKSWRAISGMILLGAALLTGGGCGNQAQAENERRNKGENLPASLRIAPEIVGTWHRRQNDVSEYARYAENLGDFETYEIAPDGRVRRTNLIAAKIYDCPVEDIAVSVGAVNVESEDSLNIRLDTGTLRHTEGCAPRKNFVRPTIATITDYRWKLGKTADGADELCLTGASGETICYRRGE